MYTFSDLTYVLFPIIIIWRLNMRLRTKVYLCLMMSLSLVTMAASLMKSVNGALANGRVKNNNGDAQYQASVSLIYGGLEQCLVIILTCVPALRVANKLNFPYLRSIGSSLARIVRGTPRHSSQSKQSALVQHDSNQQLWMNLEMQPGVQQNTVVDAKWGDHQIPMQAHVAERQDGAFGSQRQIWRTDQYTVDYERGRG